MICFVSVVSKLELRRVQDQSNLHSVAQLGLPYLFSHCMVGVCIIIIIIIFVYHMAGYCGNRQLLDIKECLCLSRRAGILERE